MAVGAPFAAFGAGGGGGAAAGLGLSALGLPFLAAFAPALIASLFGDPQRRLRRQVANLTGPQNVERLTSQFFQQALASPAFSQAQGLVASGANTAGADVARALAQRGIGTTGVGAIVPALQSSLVGSQLAGLQTAAHTQAQQQAQQAIQAQLNALLNIQGASPARQLTGTGIEAFMPFLLAYMKSRFPQFGGAARAA